MSVPKSASRWLLFMALLCMTALGLGLVAQHQFDMRPCAWCVLQRGIYLLLACSLAVAAMAHRGPQKITVAFCLLLCLSGVVSALYQHQVAAQTLSCKLSVADKIISALALEELLPSVFGVMATCADAQVTVMGVPFALWSLGLFIALGCGCVGILRTRF
jgi:protein dithiol:quinone oxidoreductase